MLTQRNFLLTTLLLVFLLNMNQNAEAQEPQKFRVVVANNLKNPVETSTNGEIVDISAMAAEALLREFTSTIKSKCGLKFDVIGKQEVDDSAERLGIKSLSAEGYQRIAEELKADLLVKSESIAVLTLARKAYAGITIAVWDVSIQELVGFGVATRTARKMEQAVERAVKTATQQCWERLRITAKVQQVVKDIVVLDRGIREGVYSGRTLLIVRRSEDGLSKVGKVRVVRQFAIDAEAEVVERSDFRPGDCAILIYSVENLRWDRVVCPPREVREEPQECVLCEKRGKM